MHIDDIKKILAPYLSEFNQAYTDIAKSDISLLNDIISHIKLSSGKQIRPIFTYLSTLLCGEITPKTTRTALAIELLHTSTLIHDDVVDNSSFRRGKETINEKWDNRLAVLSGDYLLSLVLRILSEGNDVEILSILSNVAKDLSEGEILQQEKSALLDYSEESYYEIIRKKTAALISACFEGGAISVNAEQKDISLLKKVGEYVGIAFQIKDDILDYDVCAKTGKIYGNDIRERKFTMPLIYYMNNSSEKERDSILNIFRQDVIIEKDIDFIIEKINSSDSISYTRAAMEHYINKALQGIEQFEDSEVKNILKKTISYVIEREL